ncbi:DUF805 domain-containing protein [Bacillus sp. EAC]|uniref:DUF805 domain-containing protein n=1 Tax=Bacillus sp. EAC TaxID=1978338 RepID=UPI000B447426|nr:DUF805 domain-containing protein [Bacillus sp. EAC]
MNWYIKVLKNSYDFSGRARRKEYWMFTLTNTLFNFLVTGVLVSTNASFVVNIVAIIYYVLMFIPILSVSIRRLHDIGKNGWWLLISVLPFIWFLPLFLLPVAQVFGINMQYQLVGLVGIFVSLLTIICFIVMITFFCIDSQNGGNQYGANPKGE